MSYAVHAERVEYCYADGRRGLSPVSLQVQAGDNVLVSGPSGCGKSTLARCLTGLIPHLYRGSLQGHVWVADLPTDQTPLWQLSEYAGLVLQNPAAQMLALTVEEEVEFGLENLGLPAAEIRQRLESTLIRFGLVEMRKRAPQTLSGGEQQKLALAAILARRPPLLVLDEPLSMLDTTASIELVAHLGDLVRSGMAMVICEHRCEYVRTLPGLRRMDLGEPSVSDPPVVTWFDPRQQPVGPFCLQVAGLSVRLGGRMVLNDLNLSLAGGQVVALVGRNGVGKTTLLRALLGLQPYEGSVTVDGRPPELTLVFQNADLQLFNPSVRAEITYRLPQPDPDLYEWLLLTLGLKAYEDTPPLLLSEGEKKRVALATALLRKARHGVLLDEPTLGQDSAHKAMLLRVAHALAARGQLVLIATHDLALAAHADRLLLLGPDGLAADGAPTQVLNDAQVWAQLGIAVPVWMREPGTLERVA